MINTLFLPELREMLADGDTAGLREICSAVHPAAVAEFIGGLSADQAWQVVQHADHSMRDEIFQYFDHALQLEIIHTQPRDQIAELIASLPPDDRVDMLKGADDDVVDELLKLVPSEERRDILILTAYPEGTAGAVMTTDVACFDEGWTVRQALQKLQERGEDFETIYYLYIIDDLKRLCGLVSARQLVSRMGKPDSRLGEIMETELITADVGDDQEEVAHLVARYDLLAIPVVDDQHRMLGIITYDDIIDVLQDEATEDAHRIAAVEPLERGYLDTPLLVLSWKRGIWLSILFFAAALTAMAIRRYEGEMERWAWLVMFIPLVISSGGNSGSQAATLVITGLARNDVTRDDWWRVLRREVIVGAILGSFLALCACLLAPLLTSEIQFNSLRTLAVLPLTMIAVVMAGTLLGSSLPLVFQRLGWDPAMMSSPFVAGIIDILGIVIYMNVALLLLT